MNFLIKFPKVGFIFFSFLGLCQFPAFPQLAYYKSFANPHVQFLYPNYLDNSGEYLQLIQDSQDNIFLAAEHGVLKFNNKEWLFTGIPGPACLALTEDQVLYAGGNNIFGTVGTDLRGKLTFTPLPGNDSKKDFNPGKIIRIIPLRSKVYVLSEKGLFFFENEALTEILPDTGISDIFSVNGQIVAYSHLSGLQVISGTSPVPLLPADQLSGHHINDVISFKDSIFIIADGGQEIFLVSDNKMPDTHVPCTQIIPWKIMLIKNFPGYYCLVNTDKNDMTICDMTGNLLTTITGDHGIRIQGIRDIYFDGSDNLWIVQEQALCRVELFSPLSFFSLPSGTKGEIRNIGRLGDQLLISSSAGLYAMCSVAASRVPANAGIVAITDHEVSCKGMVLFGESMLVSSSEGIYEYSSASGPRIIFPVPTGCISRSSVDTTVLYASIDTGIILLKYEKEDWTTLGMAEGIDRPVTSIYETKDRIVWAGTFDAGLFSAPVPEHFNPGEKIRFAAGSLLPPDAGSTIRLFYLNNSLLASSSSGLFQYDEATGAFTPHPVCNSIADRTQLRQPVITGNPSGAWLSFFDASTGRTTMLSFDPRTNKPGSIDTLEYRRLDKLQIYSMFDDRNALWLATNAGPAMIDINCPSPETPGFFTFIDRVIINRDSVIGRPVLESLSPGDKRSPGRLVIPHTRNNLRFEFISTDYNSEGKALFQYMLEGRKSLLSDWSDNFFADLQDLPGGRYSLAVRSKDIYGNISSPARMSFTVRVPIYFAWWAFIIYAVCILFLIYFYRKWKHFQHLKAQYKIEEIIQERTESLLKDKEKTDSLLANILPQKTADELKSTGKASTSKFKMVTVLFSDIQGFTKIAEQMNPEKLIDELDKFYFQFDTVVEKYNIEKIKTIGDAYMAAGGIPVKNRTNPVEVVLAGLEMQHFMNELKKSKDYIWDLRIGIHTGSVIAGVVGQKKFTYDIWGDTVNTASRMESSGEAGKVNISGTCYNLVQQFFECEHRGKMPVKYKGDIDMYFVKGLKPEFRAELEYSGNHNLQVQLQLLRLQDLEEIIIQRLETDIPEYLFYHNASHTSHVYAQVELLGRSEGIGEEDMLLVRTAALLHDIGFIYQFAEHEKKSAEVAREILPAYKFTVEQIDSICKLILATSIPHEPENLVEQIIIDANLDHLGRVDFLILSDRLFQEYRTMKIFSSKKAWNEHQINFLSNHEFYTAAANSLREISRKDQIENIRKFS